MVVRIDQLAESTGLSPVQCGFESHPGHMSKKYGRQILIDRIPEKLYTDFKALARRRGKSMAGYLRELMGSAVFQDRWMNEGGNFDVGRDPEEC